MLGDAVARTLCACSTPRLLYPVPALPCACSTLRLLYPAPALPCACSTLCLLYPAPALPCACSTLCSQPDPAPCQPHMLHPGPASYPSHVQYPYRACHRRCHIPAGLSTALPTCSLCPSASSWVGAMPSAASKCGLQLLLPLLLAAAADADAAGRLQWPLPSPPCLTWLGCRGRLRSITRLSSCVATCCPPSLPVCRRQRDLSAVLHAQPAARDPGQHRGRQREWQGAGAGRGREHPLHGGLRAACRARPPTTCTRPMPSGSAPPKHKHTHTSLPPSFPLPAAVHGHRLLPALRLPGPQGHRRGQDRVKRKTTGRPTVPAALPRAAALQGALEGVLQRPGARRLIPHPLGR